MCFQTFFCFMCFTIQKQKKKFFYIRAGKLPLKPITPPDITPRNHYPSRRYPSILLPLRILPFSKVKYVPSITLMLF